MTDETPILKTTSLSASKPLNEMQRRFCEELVGDNPIPYKAYLAVGYKAASASVASACASRLLADPRIQAYIEGLRREQRALSNVDITPDRVINEYALLGFARMTDFATWTESTMSLKASADLEPGLSAAVVEVRHEERFDKNGSTKITSIKLHPKIPALQMLAKHVGVGMDLNTALRVMDRYGMRVIDPFGAIVEPDANADQAALEAGEDFLDDEFSFDEDGETETD